MMSFGVMSRSLISIPESPRSKVAKPSDILRDQWIKIVTTIRPTLEDVLRIATCGNKLL